MPDPETLRNRIARIIASTRFPFVDQDTWETGLQTIVNDETKRYAIRTDIGVLYPNIVIAYPDGSIRELGLVETSVSEENVAKWKALSDVAPYGREYKKLFIYVPEGSEEQIKQLLEKHEIDYDGIRAYRVENQNLKIIPYVTRNDEYDHTVT